MLSRNYNCTQQELYTAAELAWQSCLQHITSFSAFSPLYEAAYIDARQAEVKNAYNLPDEQARTAETEILRIELSQLAVTATGNWQKLKRYISKAWAPEFQKSRVEEAGAGYYARAGNEDWEGCKGLLSSGSNFIAKNLAALTDNLNMPAGFQTTFDDNKTLFLEKHQLFLDSEEASRIATEEKIKANNAVYSQFIAMCRDGQEIFKKEDAVLKQFIFEHILNLVSGTGTAGFKGTVTDEQTSQPIAEATLQIKGSEKTTISGEDGKYILQQLAEGSYQVTISKEGYQPKEIKQTVISGTVSTLNIALHKA